MNIQYFKQNASKLCRSELSEQLGYHSHRKFTKTFHQFIQSASIHAWLEQGHYDFVSNAKGFFIAVARFAGFSDSEIKEQLNDFDRLQREKAKFKDAFIFVNTHFKRRNEPLFALGHYETTRRIKLHDNQRLLFKNRVELLAELAGIIVKHYKENQGILPVWGKIHDYRIHLNNEVMIFDPEARACPQSKHVHC